MPLPPPNPSLAAKDSNPQNHRIFDPWNSVSSGHQRAENPYSSTTSWRDTRSAKLKQQFRGEDCAGDRAGALDDEDFSLKAFDGTCGSVSPVAETYGCAPTDRGHTSGDGNRSRAGEWRWVSEEEATRAQLGMRDIRCFMGVGKRKAGGDEVQMQMQAVKKVKAISETGRGEKAILHTIPSRMVVRSSHASAPVCTAMTGFLSKVSTMTTESSTSIPKSTASLAANPKSEHEIDLLRQLKSSSSQIFSGTTIYVNGSTLPQISDHKLKSLLAAHGATIAIAMARKAVSHIIIGQPGTLGQGAGGGLAARKLQGEIERGGWKGVRVVGVDWVLESIKAGKRLAESRFAVLSIAPKGQRSVAAIFGR